MIAARMKAHSFNVNQSTVFVIDQLRGELSTFLRAGSHDVLQQ
jgi:hypothetical protein